MTTHQNGGCSQARKWAFTKNWKKGISITKAIQGSSGLPLPPQAQSAQAQGHKAASTLDSEGRLTTEHCGMGRALVESHLGSALPNWKIEAVPLSLRGDTSTPVGLEGRPLNERSLSHLKI